MHQIRIRTEEWEVVDEAEASLKDAEGVYQRGGSLVNVQTDAGVLAGIARAPGAPRITRLPLAALRTILTRTAAWTKATETRGGEYEDKPAHPPDWAVKGLEALGRWSHVPHLEGVTETPTLRPDGSLLTKPGYDAASGLLFVPPECFALAEVKARPTLDDARKALELLAEVVCDVPLETPAHRAAWVASVLTPLARYAFRGPAPLFLFDANVRGAGKSLLSDVVSELLTGRPFARFAQVEHEAEERKRITSIALSGHPLVLIDNLTRPLGSGALDAALTSEEWADRSLGSNTDIRVPLRTTWYATGNNVQIQNDTARRVLHVRISSLEERPELREGFRHDPLLPWVREARPRLLAAALTVLRAFVVAGKPAQSIARWGSFDGWSSIVRASLVWCGWPDPAETRAALEAASDSEALALEDLISGWASAAPRGATVTAILNMLSVDDAQARYPRLLEALGELCPSSPGRLPTARAVGNKLAHLRGRVVAGRMIKRDDTKTNAGVTWRVVTVAQAYAASDSSASSDSLLHAARVNGVDLSPAALTRESPETLESHRRGREREEEKKRENRSSQIGLPSPAPPPHEADPEFDAREAAALLAYEQAEREELERGASGGGLPGVEAPSPQPPSLSRPPSAAERRSPLGADGAPLGPERRAWNEATRAALAAKGQRP